MKSKTPTPKIIDFKIHNWNQQAQIIHKLHEKWWQDTKTGEPIKRDSHELLLLVVTEIAEATEGLRKSLPDDKLKHRSMHEVEMADAYIRLMDFAGGFKIKFRSLPFLGYPRRDKSLDRPTSYLWEIVENLVEATRQDMDFIASKAGRATENGIAMIQTYCGKFSLDLEGSINEKLAFNQKRKDHTHAARRGKNGKKF